MNEIFDYAVKVIVIIFIVAIFFAVLDGNKSKELQELEIENLKLRTEKLELLIEMQILDKEEIFDEIDCINQNLDFLFGVGDPCQKSFPDFYD